MYGGRAETIPCALNIEIVSCSKVATVAGKSLTNKYMLVSDIMTYVITSVDRSFFFMFVCHVFTKLPYLTNPD